ncbi:MAG: hypothetical protein K6U08_09695 [Firmicutes bacterium]|nr:hypothetical protein [Bacillota bacterium]
MSTRTGVLVFEGGQATGGDRGTARGLLATVRRWATLDNVEKFLACPEVDLVAVATDCPDLAAEASRLGAVVRKTGPDFHFGRVFRELVREHGLGRVVYLGGGAVPLVGPAELEFLWEHLSPGECAFVANNAQSPDVIALGRGEAAEVIAGLAADNAAVFALTEAGYERRLLPESAATVFDLDTPTDVIFLAYEIFCRGRLDRASRPGLGPRLRAGLPTLDLDLDVLERAAAVLGRDDYSTVTLVGRVSGTTVSFLNANFLVRLRVFSEERGMKALGRVERGEVRSLLGFMAADRGVGYLVGVLASISDAVFWDDRVLVAHLGGWPDDEDRFLADLGDWRRVKDPLLRDLIRACREAHVPFVLGGHSVVSGGLRLLGEGLLAGRAV